MNKIINFVLSVVILISLFFINTHKVHAESSELDQRCNAHEEATISPLIGKKDIQTFKPSKNMLTKVGVFVKRTGKFSLKVMDSAGKTLASKTITIGLNSPDWQYHEFSPVAVTPEETYKIILQGIEGDPYWGFQYHCYDRGSAYANNVLEDAVDFGFETYGYTTSSANISNTDNSGTNSSTDSGSQDNNIADNNKQPTTQNSATNNNPSFFSNFINNPWAIATVSLGVIIIIITVIAIYYFIKKRKKTKIQN